MGRSEAEPPPCLVARREGALLLRDRRDPTPREPSSPPSPRHCPPARRSPSASPSLSPWRASWRRSGAYGRPQQSAATSFAKSKAKPRKHKLKQKATKGKGKDKGKGKNKGNDYQDHAPSAPWRGGETSAEEKYWSQIAREVDNFTPEEKYYSWKAMEEHDNQKKDAKDQESMQNKVSKAMGVIMSASAALQEAVKLLEGCTSTTT